MLGSRIYYFGTVCHDWADKFCVEFLSNTAQAMEKGYSTLLIYDYVMPEQDAPIPRGCVGRADDEFVCRDRKNGKLMESDS